MTLKEMKSIKVTHEFNGETSEMLISFNQFKDSFIDEKWSDEERSNYYPTLFGEMHHKTVVTSPWGSESVRTFDFPKSREEAEARHKEAE